MTAQQQDPSVEAEQAPSRDGAADQPAAAAFSCTTESLSSPTGEIIVLRVGGEVDLLTIPAVEAAVAYHLDRRPAHLLVDLARVQFCSARGMSLLAGARGTATRRGIGYAISGLPARLGRIWDELWPGELPPRYPSTAVAVTAIRSGPHRGAR